MHRLFKINKDRLQLIAVRLYSKWGLLEQREVLKYYKGIAPNVFKRLKPFWLCFLTHLELQWVHIIAKSCPNPIRTAKTCVHLWEDGNKTVRRDVHCVAARTTSPDFHMTDRRRVSLLRSIPMSKQSPRRIGPAWRGSFPIWNQIILSTIIDSK